ncbi:hypothetical protein ABZ924_08215 [Streptomyces sp. NPDC046876]|uniref:hypothetical protein n=1 Tax=Streptomyces sp. NPDC046876 TaxID=3155616 RepID=UPI0033C12313
MTTMPEPPPATAAARQQVAELRGGDPAELAEALEQLATAAMDEGDLGAAAAALEEAAGLWDRTREAERQGFCLLLAATAQRLRGDLGAARHNLERAAAADLPEAVRRAFGTEQAEQALAAGDAQAAYEGFGAALDALDAAGQAPLDAAGPDAADAAGPDAPAAAGPDALVRARILQRRAAAALAAQRWYDAAGDLMDAEELLFAHGDHDEAEAAALGAALAVAHVAPDTAERVWDAATATAPRDGVAAARRAVAGGRIALLADDPARALRRFDEARRAALDAADPLAYLAAVQEAVGAAELLGDDATAYARLATAWATVGDLLGRELSRRLVRPLLEGLRERLGPRRFAAARTAYEARADGA